MPVRPPRPRRRASAKRIAFALVFAGGAALFFALDLARYFDPVVLRRELASWQGYVGDHPAWSAVVFFLAYALAGAVSIPGAIIRTLVAGALFGLVLGTAIVWI